VNASRAFRLGVVLATIWLPWPARRLLYRGLLHWTIDADSSIGLSFVDARSLHLRNRARIGHFNVIRQMAVVDVGADTTIGQWNWITSSTELASDTGGYLIVGHDSAITSRHYIDCSGGVRIGNHTTVAGVRSVVLSHQIDVVQNAQSIAPVEIGNYVLVSSNVCLTPGSRIPSSCVIAMGAVVVGKLGSEGALYAGVPARLKRRGIADGAYFGRTEGVVRPGVRPPKRLPSGPQGASKPEAPAVLGADRRETERGA
jgi:acetyltransferase-like isoleucine patch superfamily enzyme